MKKVMVIGCPGAGKEHFCQKASGTDRASAVLSGYDLA